MVHTKCRNPKGRGRPSTEFYVLGRPQIYCRGWIDRMTDEPLSVCRRCPDFTGNEQLEQDMKWYMDLGMIG